MELISNILIYTAGILWGLELIPQLRKTLKTKKVNDLSLAFFMMCFLAYVMYIIGNVIVNSWNIVIAHIPSLVANMTMIVLILKYKGEKK